MSKKYFLYISIAAAVLAFGVVMLGAYVRLSQAGLGCPDWPGCYGHMSVPSVAQAAVVDAARPLESARAWKEMVHRYFAGTLATLILVLTVLAWWRRKEPGQPLVLPTLLLGLVIFQALLGMWTVTLLLFPPVVMGHLLGGFATFALLVLLVLQSGAYLREGRAAELTLRRLAALGLLALVVQIALGGWTSSNYAAIACPAFPACGNPTTLDFAAGFSWQGLGPDYQGGILTDAARAAIQVAHRCGALAVFLLLGAASLMTWLKAKSRPLRALGALVGLLLLAQIGLGISLVEFGWPLAVADLHNGVAALLLGATVALNWAVWAGRFDR